MVLTAENVSYVHIYNVMGTNGYRVRGNLQAIHPQSGFSKDILFNIKPKA